MKALKIFGGLVLVVAALFVIIGEQLSGASANAFVNAQSPQPVHPLLDSLGC